MAGSWRLRARGKRGGGGWERVTWEAALTEIGGRIRTAIVEGRRHELMYHVGRPGEDGYANRVLKMQIVHLAYSPDGGKLAASPPTMPY